MTDRIFTKLCFSTLLLCCLMAVGAKADGGGSNEIGNWRVAPMSELAGESCHAAELDDGHWQALELPGIKPQLHLCIRANLDIDVEALPTNPALLFLALAAYEVYLDGNLLGKNGLPGSDKESEQVGAISSLLNLDQSRIEPGEHLLSMELSSFHVEASTPSIAHSLTLVDGQGFYDLIIVVSAFTALLIGVLLAMFGTFLTLYLGFSRQSSYLIFALLCFSTAGLLVAEQWKLWVNYRFDVHLTRLYIVTAITLAVTTLLPLYYLLHHGMGRKRFWLSGLALALVATVWVAPSFDTRSEWLFILAFTFVLAINLVALKQRKAGAKVALFITGVSLLALLVAPTLFLELGFGISTSLVMASIGLSLLRRLIKQRKQALETGKVKGELLRRNLQPHYMMNCLMQMQELIDVAPRQANEFVQQLAEEFRTLVKMSDKPVVHLEEELQLCRSHLKIMSVRYQKNFRLAVNVDHSDPSPNTSAEKEVANVQVPAAILHSQIENCFTHNQITASQSMTLQVTARGNWVTLTLTTPIESATEHQGVGIGEAYIRAKMAQVCEAGWHLHCGPSEGSWVTEYRYRISSGILKQQKREAMS